MRRRESADNNKSNLDQPLLSPTIDVPKSLIFIIPTSLVMGVVFGFALEKGRVFEPMVIVDQMLMKRFQMMKMFLSAVSSSVIAMAVLSNMKSTSKIFDFSRGFIYAPSRPGLLATAIGAMILGSGMALCGACPGTVAVQFGAGIAQAPIVVVGGIAAGIFWTLLSPLFNKIYTANTPTKENKAFENVLGTSFTKIAIPLAIGLISFVVGLEYFFPWRSELTGKAASSLLSNTPFYAQRAWAPYLAGAIVGLLNIPAVLMLRVSIGSATTYQIVAAHLLRIFMPKKISTIKDVQPFFSPIGLWQPIYLLGAMLGAFLSSYLSGTFATTESVGLMGAFFGGFVLILGSRLAGGCTSGHGITGFSFLQTISFIAVPAMFAGGISTAFLLKYLGFYSH